MALPPSLPPFPPSTNVVLAVFFSLIFLQFSLSPAYFPQAAIYFASAEVMSAHFWNASELKGELFFAHVKASHTVRSVNIWTETTLF